MISSRFANLSRRQALVVITALTVALLFSISRFSAPAVPGTTTAPPVAGAVRIATVPEKNDDLILYTAITNRMANGEAYYPVAADEQRKGNYPLRPFIAMRLSTLAAISATLGTTAMTAILYGLLLATLLAWRQRLRNHYSDPGRRNLALGLLLAGMIVAFWREFIVLHEIWAGILLALAFGLHRPGKWLPSALIAGCALMIRELSLPFILLMTAFATYDRRWREVATLAAIVALFGVIMASHAQHVAAVTTLADAASPGWANFGGWPSFVRTMQMPSVLRAVPPALASVAIILSLFGWLSWQCRTGLFGTLMFAGYGVLFMALGRPDNFYWGFMVVPTFLIGLTFLPAAFSDLRIALSRKLDFAPA